MNKRHSKSSIMLLEIMINICFFAVMIAICMQLLIKALNVSNKATALNDAVTASESIAETYRAVDGDMGSFLDVYDEAVDEDNKVTIYLDDSLSATEQEDATYIAVLQSDNGSHLSNATIDFYTADDTTESIYELNVAAYRGIGGED